MRFSAVLALCGSAIVVRAFDVAYYTPLSNVSAELGYDDFLPISAAMGSGDTATALRRTDAERRAAGLREMSTQAAATMGSQATFLQFAIHCSAADFAHRFRWMRSGGGDFVVGRDEPQGARHQGRELPERVAPVVRPSASNRALCRAQRDWVAVAPQPSWTHQRLAAAGPRGWRGRTSRARARAPMAAAAARVLTRSATNGAPVQHLRRRHVAAANNERRARGGERAARAHARRTARPRPTPRRHHRADGRANPPGALREAYEVDPDGGAEDADGVVEIAEVAFARRAPLAAGCSGSAAASCAQTCGSTPTRS